MNKWVSRAFLFIAVYLYLIRVNKHITMEQGKIARLTDRGFGFISREGETKDLFFHSKELVGVEYNDLKEGDTVQFEVSESPKGPNATKVSRV